MGAGSRVTRKFVFLTNLHFLLSQRLAQSWSYLLIRRSPAGLGPYSPEAHSADEKTEVCRVRSCAKATQLQDRSPSLSVLKAKLATESGGLG